MKQYLRKGIIGLIFLLILVIVWLLWPQQGAHLEKNNDVGANLTADLEQVNGDSFQQIVNYLNNNYILKDSDLLLASEVDGRAELSLADFAYYTSKLLKEIGIEADVIRYESADLVNLVLIFRYNDLPQYIAFTTNGLVVKHHGWSFKDLIISEEERLNIEILRFLYFPFGYNDFREAVPPFNWEYLK